MWYSIFMETISHTLKILFCEIKDWEKDLISKCLPDVQVSFLSEKISTQNSSQYFDVDILSVFVDSKLDAEMLSNFAKLKLIATRSTGYDHIDVEYCKQHNILIVNVPSYGENTVAEHTLALILALLKRIPESIERVKSGNFNPDGLTGSDIKDKIIGVVGTGHIGVHVIKYVQAMGAKVIAYDAFPNSEIAHELKFEYADINHLMSKADIITFHTPLNKSTFHMFNRKSLSLVKDGVIVINTARGGIIDTDVLFDGIKSGKIGGAGLDVLEEEAFIKEELELLHNDKYKDVDFKVILENQMLPKFANVIITPHNAFNSHEALKRIIMTTIDNVKCYSQGNCRNLIKQ